MPPVMIIEKAVFLFTIVGKLLLYNEVVDPLIVEQMRLVRNIRNCRLLALLFGSSYVVASSHSG